MSSTEQKNVSQHFVNSCINYGILATLQSDCFGEASLQSGDQLFGSLGETPAISQRIRAAGDILQDCRSLFPVLCDARAYTRRGPLIMQITHNCRVYYGNQAVMRFVEGVISRRWAIFFRETGAIKHAKRHASRTISYLAPGAYGEMGRAGANVLKFEHREEANTYRCAADAIDFLAHNTVHPRYNRRTNQWCTSARADLDIRVATRTSKHSIDIYNRISPEDISALPEPPTIETKIITLSKNGKYRLQIYYSAGCYYLKFVHRHKQTSRNNITFYSPKQGKHIQPRAQKTENEVYVLSHRDLMDIVFLLTAAAQVKLYHTRRRVETRNLMTRNIMLRLQSQMWSTYKAVMQKCGEQFHLRNKLGVYFDVLQWRYLAKRSGDIFYNHSDIMGNKVESKGLRDLPSQDPLLELLHSCPVDVAVDMLGIYKASIYPEVDPFKVVSEQRILHESRHQTEWEDDSPERSRFDETKAYMWYLGVHTLNSRFGIWPGKIREGVEAKDWHANYKKSGIPGRCWRDGHDVDLSGVITTADITNEHYFRQQDSACAPPLRSEFLSFENMRRAPRRHRRKLLYAIQEPALPDLQREIGILNRIGNSLPDGYVGRIEYNPEFSTDIVTGSRCERHKDAPRPFYAASPPWGCIISYIDGITRDFLSHVPQNMLGKSTRQKFLDLSSMADERDRTQETFYMSDDKAKYSPRMDPHSQQLPADFFAEVFSLPAIKAYGPVMYHCELYYRVHGHLVHYNSNGTDREGMRGASNTWVEIVAQGLATRLSRERDLLVGKSKFLSFIDDGLRKFSVKTVGRSPEESYGAAQEVISDVIFGLKVLGRELSWDKTFISRSMFVILNELVIDGTFISSGLKSFCTIGDLEMKEVMTAADYEQLYFGKMRGAHGVGTPIDLCHYIYVFETLMSHFRMGVTSQDNQTMSNFDYRMFCITPLALGGAGIRSALQMSCTEVASATKEGIGNLQRLGTDMRFLMHSVQSILNQPLAPLNPIDFMREPEQFHVSGPRIKTQRLAAKVRQELVNLASNEMSKGYLAQDAVGMELLRKMGNALLTVGDVSAEEVRLTYASTPVAFIDEFVQKLASSTTLSEMLSRDALKGMRNMAKRDLVEAANYFRTRCASRELLMFASGDVGVLALVKQIMD